MFTLTHWRPPHVNCWSLALNKSFIYRSTTTSTFNTKRDERRQETPYNAGINNVTFYDITRQWGAVKHIIHVKNILMRSKTIDFLV